MMKRSVLCLALALATASAFGCSGSSPSDVTTDTDGGTPPTTDSGTTPTTPDSGTTPTTPDSGSTPAVDAGAPACTTKTYANFGQAFFATKCNGCHSIQRPTLTTQTAIRNNLGNCKSDINSGRMPQGSRLSAQEKADVMEWLNCGAP